MRTEKRSGQRVPHMDWCTQGIARNYGGELLVGEIFIADNADDADTNANGQDLKDREHKD